MTAKRFATVAGFVLIGAMVSYGCGEDYTPRVSISEIQGEGHNSPLEDVRIEVRGVVTAKFSETTFFIQSVPDDADDNPLTSEGLLVASLALLQDEDGNEIKMVGDSPDFVFEGPSEGDVLVFTGVVREISSGGDLPATTGFARAKGRYESRGGTPPGAVDIGDIPDQLIAADVAFVGGDPEVETEGAAGTFDAGMYAIDYYETLENMLVSIPSPIAVGPTVFGKVPTVAEGDASNLTERNTLVIAENDFHPERLLLDETYVFVNSEDPEMPNGAPAVDAGYRFGGAVEGIVTTDAFDYIVIVKGYPEGTESDLQPESTTITGGPGQLTVGTYNVLNLLGDAAEAAFDADAAIIVDRMGSPDIIGLQEMGGAAMDEVAGAATFTALIEAITRAGGPAYEFAQIDPADGADGGAPGVNIRVGFLYNPATVTFTPTGTPDATTPVTVTGGNVTPNPGRILDTNTEDGDAFADSRKPIVAQFDVGGEAVYVVNAHLSSRSGDPALFAENRVPPDMRDPPGALSEAQRMAQTAEIAAVVDQLPANANVIVLGDMNTFTFEPSIANLEGAGLTNLVTTLDAGDQYSYIFIGNAQVLDHILVSDNLTSGAQVDIVHTNAEFAASASDHDPIVARVNLQ